MRITQETLLKIAEESIAERVDDDLLGVYLHGSVAVGEPVLGETADIDLVFIHHAGAQPREIVRLTADVHLDIIHHPRSEYEPARELRQDALKGATIYSYRMLYDPEHFLDFTQASVRGMYDQPDNILGRAEPQLRDARQQWLNFHNTPPRHGTKQVWDYLTALENTANALVCLKGPPLSGRRFLAMFPERTEALGHSGLAHGLAGLLGLAEADAETIRAWLPAWEAAYDAAAIIPEITQDLHPERKLYYLRAIETLANGDWAQAAAWPLLRTWTQAAKALGDLSPGYGSWLDVCEERGLRGPGFEERLEGFDAYLDTIEEIFEDWKAERGF